ncbi:MAG: A/G-specific adenine glycosylase [Planctomycetota bacterium]
MADNTLLPNVLAADQAKAFRRRLLAWYRKHRRDLPWREMNGRPVNPYHVLLSEAMLQQTQVATVVPYFHRFIEAFPTIHVLAEADEQRVLTLWQGLGYYRRARNLHASAKKIVEDFAGEVPRSVGALLQLPGIGRYTAGAIASIAHGTRAAVVDGNVERVFARLMLIEEAINAPETKRRLWQIAESLVPKRSPGDYNQALMELGATVCTPKLPQCFVCPVRPHCRGVQEANPETLPVKLPKKKPKEVTHIVIAIERNGKYLFEQRSSEGLWANMWQLPTVEDTEDEVEARAWTESRFGITIRKPEPTTVFRHQTTHRTIRFVLLKSGIQAGRLRAKSGFWHRLDRLDHLPMSNPQRVCLKHLRSD